MGKPRNIGIRENSTKQLILAIELIEEHVSGKDDKLRIACTLIKTSITHMTEYPSRCEFSDGCKKLFEDEYEPEPPERDESRD